MGGGEHTTTADTPPMVAVERCPACGSDARALLYEPDDWLAADVRRFPIIRCESCKSSYVDPRPSPAALAEQYESLHCAHDARPEYRLFARSGLPAWLWYGTKRGILRRRYGYRNLGGSSVLARLLGWLPAVHERATFALGVLLHSWRPDGALLDIGCGSGHYLDLMRALGWARVVGVDVSLTAVEDARELGIEAHCGDLRELAMPDSSFDAVSISHALEHIDDPVGLLAEARRVTKPGGRIAIAVPNARSLLARVARGQWIGLDTPRHVVNFSPAGLRIALNMAGLMTESVRTPARFAYVWALATICRAQGVRYEVCTAEGYRFGARRRLAAGALSAIEHGLCAARLEVGEQICAVARA